MKLACTYKYLAPGKSPRTFRVEFYSETRGLVKAKLREVFPGEDTREGQTNV